MPTDPKTTLDVSPMSPLQITVVTLCILLLAIDGFDVLSISFASPGIAAAWGVDRATLGVVLSMELIGMGIGSIWLGGIADSIGRRPTILMCLVIMSAGMFLASTADNVTTLSIFRVATGLGIGGILASASAMAAEFSNARRRNLSVALMAAGYPLGAIVGGTIASILLINYDWPAVFLFGSVATASFIPLVWLFMPESIDFLVHKRPAKALERVNATLVRMRHAPVTELLVTPTKTRKINIASLFEPGLSSTTTLLTLAYFGHIMSFYFLLKWIPKIVVDMGFAASAAGGVLVWASVGGLSGSVLLSLLTQRFNVRPLVIGTFLLSAIAIVIFGQDQPDIKRLTMVAAFAGFFTNAAIVGLYAMFAQSFPTAVRASGTGFVIGIGRGGAALGPIIAGLLFASGQGLSTVALYMALGSIIAAIALKTLSYKEPSLHQ